MKRLALLLLPLTAFAAAPVADWAPNATGVLAWHNNVSNGAAGWDRVGALQAGFDVIASSEFEVTRHDKAHLTVHLLGDWYPRFWKLARAGAGPRADWRHVFGEDEFAPVFSAEIGGDFIATAEAARRGTASFVELTLAKRFKTGWRAALRERFDDYAAKLAVFDARGTETIIEVGRDVAETTRLTVSAGWRKGDVVTYAQFNRPDLMAIANASADLTTFRTPMTAYSTDARTLTGRVALVHATAEDTAFVLSYEYARSDRTGLRFANQVVGISVVRQY